LLRLRIRRRPRMHEVSGIAAGMPARAPPLRSIPPPISRHCAPSPRRKTACPVCTPALLSIRCLTCDHDTSVSHNPREIDRYIDAIEREAQLVTAHLGRRRLQQLHLGGGTPNYLSDTQLVRLLDIIDRYFDIDDNTEASLDANAHRASYSQLSLLRGLGFSGLNLAIRDLDPGVQRALGRAQSLPVITDVIEAARDLGFTTVSTDLVYGLPSRPQAASETPWHSCSPCARTISTASHTSGARTPLNISAPSMPRACPPSRTRSPSSVASWTRCATRAIAG
jgi:hypothetical protein